MFNIKDKVKVMKRGESGGFNEVGRGYVVGLADGKDGQWVHFVDQDWPSLDCAEWIKVNSNRSRVLKW